MNKLICFLIIFLVSFSNIYAYNPSSADVRILNKIYKKIDRINSSSDTKIKKILPKFKIIKNEYRNKAKINYILWELIIYMEEILNVKDESINTTTENNNSNIVKNSTNMCKQSLSDITKNYNKTSSSVSNYTELSQALKVANSRTNQTKYYEIILKKWDYNLQKILYVTWSKIIFRSETGNRDDVVIHWQGMSTWVSHGFLITWSNILIWDLTIEKVKNHPIQIQWEKWASGLLVHNLAIYDAWEQMIKWSYGNSTNKWSENWRIQCSRFEYKSWVWPQYYIWGIDVHKWKNWIVRNNTFKNITSPESRLAEHAIHFWSDSENTLVENNLIINSDRWIWFWLGQRGHIWWIIRNNVIYHDSSKWDVGIWLENSKGTQVYNNTVFFENNYPNAIEYRFSNTSADIKNNITNKLIKKRNDWSAVLDNNSTDAQASWFKDIKNYDFELIKEVNNNTWINTHSNDTPDINEETNLATKKWDKNNFKNIYEVGPNKEYKDISDVPWASLEKSSIVLIDWKNSPYYWKFVVQEQRMNLL